MSGAIIDLVSKGVQDAYINTDDQNLSLFNHVYKKHTNFAQVAKQIDAVVTGPNRLSVIKIKSFGDLVNNIWFEGDDVVDLTKGTKFHLYIGGKKVDSQTHEFITEIWQSYMADSEAKARNLNISSNGFLPLHFFFCDGTGPALPLVALQYNEVEIQVEWGPDTPTSGIRCYANYIFLDTVEREKLVSKDLELLTTQVQRNIYKLNEGHNDFDLSILNHPVKSLFFGFDKKDSVVLNDSFTFSGCDLQINGTYVFENLSPTYFHVVQSYYRTKHGVSNFDYLAGAPAHTRFFTYNFCVNASDYSPTGTCNFSRLDNAKMTIRDTVVSHLRAEEDLKVYAVNYNIMKIKKGIAGIIFAD